MKATPPESTPSAEMPPSAEPHVEQPQPEPPRAATWPEWFHAADFLLALLVVIGAFLATSFTINNSDFWLHRASGRLLANGQYPIGGDPFSYSGDGRAWVNSSWLFDLVVYGVQAADESGAMAVALKATAFAVAFALVFLLRRSGQALWPWALAAALGALAAADAVSVRPVAASVLFLALTLLLLYRGPWQRGGWRAPILLAILFAVWANTDSCFWLGPLTILLVLIGEKLDQMLTRDAQPIDDAADPFPPAPPTAGLLRAFILGVIACCLNPMFLAALLKSPSEALAQLLPWQLGFGLPIGADKDSELAALTRSGWAYIDQLFSPTSAGIPINGVALLLLFLSGLASFVADFRRLHATHILLWIVFGALALQSAWLIPYFALISVPLIGGHLNGLSSRIPLGPWAESRTRFLLTGSGFGRVLSLLIVLLGIAAAYPGWLHSPGRDPIYGEVYRRPVEWSIQPDAGLVRTAQHLHELRADGSLPTEARGLGTSVDLANYCAWFAPEERSFVDGRYAFHRAEWPDFLAVRRAAYAQGLRPEELPDMDEVWRVCEAQKAGYVVTAIHSQRSNQLATLLSSLFLLLNQEDRWTLWHLDGRSALIGRYADAPPGRAVVDRLRFNPVRLAFGPDVEPLPEGKATFPPPTPAPGWDEFVAAYLARPVPPPPEADDPLTWTHYADFLANQATRHWVRTMQKRITGRLAVAGPIAKEIREVQPVEDAQYALPVLAVRAARRAVAIAPDRAEPYYALVTAYQMPLAPIDDHPQQIPARMSERQLQILTAQVRFLERMPPPERCGKGGLRLAAQEAIRLAANYAQTRQLDFARDALHRANSYLARLSPDDTNKLIFVNALSVLLPQQEFQPTVQRLRKATQDGRAGEEWVNILKEIENRLRDLVRQRTEQIQRLNSPIQRFQMATMRAELPELAIDIFQSSKGTNAMGGAKEQLGMTVLMAMLQLQAGHLEEADITLGDLGEQVKKFQAQHPTDDMGPVFHMMVGLALRLEGNFSTAAESLNTMAPATMPPAFRALAAIPLVTISASGGVAGAPVVAPAFEQRMQLREILRAETTYQYDRAMLALTDGDIAEARRRLEKAAHPQSLDLSRLDDPSHLTRIRRYLKLIDHANDRR